MTDVTKCVLSREKPPRRRLLQMLVTVDCPRASYRAGVEAGVPAGALLCPEPVCPEPAGAAVPDPAGVPASTD